MDPATGRFTQEDTYQGNLYDPATLHKYSYANDNPVVYCDPSGYEGTAVEAVTTIEIAAAVGATLIMAFYKDAFVKAVNNMVVDVKRDLKWFIEKMVTTHQTDEDPFIIFPKPDKISEEIALEVTKKTTLSTGNEILRVPPIDLGSNFLIFPRIVEEQSRIITISSNIVNGATNYEIKWNKSINATQETIEGTNIPKSFTIKGMYVNGNQVWVHGNATKHMGEYVNSANGSQMVENELMLSFQDAVLQILPMVQPGRNFFIINGWEIGINGDTGVIYHALYK